MSYTPPAGYRVLGDNEKIKKHHLRHHTSLGSVASPVTFSHVGCTPGFLRSTKRISAERVFLEKINPISPKNKPNQPTREGFEGWFAVTVNDPIEEGDRLVSNEAKSVDDDYVCLDSYVGKTILGLYGYGSVTLKEYTLWRRSKEPLAPGLRRRRLPPNPNFIREARLP